MDFSAIPPQYGDYFILGGISALLLLQWAWSGFVAFPMVLESKVRQGKSWVYIPLRWKGGHKAMVRLATRALFVVLAAGVSWLVLLLIPQAPAAARAAAAALVFLALWKNGVFWMRRRYRQEEDIYFHLHDELRERLLGEGKFSSDAAFKSLASYQFQSLLRKADENGTLLRTLRRERRSARRRPPRRLEEILEAG